MLTAITKATTLTAVCTMLATGFAYADITAVFKEGAPKDRFTFTNVGSCDIVDATLTLDLSGSKSGLILMFPTKALALRFFSRLKWFLAKKLSKKNHL